MRFFIYIIILFCLVVNYAFAIFTWEGGLSPLIIKIRANNDQEWAANRKNPYAIGQQRVYDARISAYHYVVDCWKDSKCLPSKKSFLKNVIEKFASDTFAYPLYMDEQANFYPVPNRPEKKLLEKSNLRIDNTTFYNNHHSNIERNNDIQRIAVTTTRPGVILFNNDQLLRLGDKFTKNEASRIVIHEILHQVGMTHDDEREIDKLAIAITNNASKKIEQASITENLEFSNFEFFNYNFFPIARTNMIGTMSKKLYPRTRFSDGVNEYDIIKYISILDIPKHPHTIAIWVNNLRWDNIEIINSNNANIFLKGNLYKLISSTPANLSTIDSQSQIISDFTIVIPVEKINERWVYNNKKMKIRHQNIQNFSAYDIGLEGINLFKINISKPIYKAGDTLSIDACVKVPQNKKIIDAKLNISSKDFFNNFIIPKTYLIVPLNKITNIDEFTSCMNFQMFLPIKFTTRKFFIKDILLRFPDATRPIKARPTFKKEFMILGNEKKIIEIGNIDLFTKSNHAINDQRISVVEEDILLFRIPINTEESIVSLDIEFNYENDEKTAESGVIIKWTTLDKKYFDLVLDESNIERRDGWQYISIKLDISDVTRFDYMSIKSLKIITQNLSEIFITL